MAEKAVDEGRHPILMMHHNLLDHLPMQRILSRNFIIRNHTITAEKFANALEVIYQFARKYEPRKELPLDFTCTCGEHLVRADIYGGMSRFICSVCESEWLIGPQEVE
mgnify:CR=1 FL=1